MDPDRRHRDRDRRRAVYAVVLGVTLLGAGLGFAASYGEARMSLANGGDDGASAFHGDLREWAARQGAPPPQPLAAGFAPLEADPDPTPNLVLLAPEHPPTDAAAQAARDVLEGGGTVLVADDTGAARPLLEDLRREGLTSSTITGHLLIDLAYSRQPFFPVLHDVRPHPLTEGAVPLVANGPSSIRPDPGDERGPHPVLTIESVPGGGSLILLGDPSILSNEMAGVEGNGALSTNLARALTAGGTPVYVDEVHRGHYPFAVLASAVPQAPTPTKVAALAALAVLPVLGLAGAAGLRRGLDRLLRPTREEDPVSRVLRDHPDWSPERLEALRDRLEHMVTEGRT